jgi:hypothetical protein
VETRLGSFTGAMQATSKGLSIFCICHAVVRASACYSVGSTAAKAAVMKLSPLFSVQNVTHLTLCLCSRKLVYPAHPPPPLSTSTCAGSHRPTRLDTVAMHITPSPRPFPPTPLRSSRALPFERRLLIRSRWSKMSFSRAAAAMQPGLRMIRVSPRSGHLKPLSS